MFGDPASLRNLRIASYVRISSDKQDAERQRQSINRWTQKYGLKIGFTFEDSVGRNPRDKADKRINFQKLLKFAETGSIDAVIVDSQDRFGAKNAHQFGKFIYELSEHGVDLWSVDQGNLSACDPATIFTTTAGAINSTAEQEKIAQRNLSEKILRSKRGEFQGGYPPFGFDTVCFDSKNKEKWRVFYDGGQHKRIKVFPNGQRERFDGKNNFPSKDPTDTLRVRPSIDKERLRTVEKIFQWYAEESISPSQIAARLNKLGIRPSISTAWHKVSIKEILTHPVYTGFPTYNKRSSGRFWQFVKGQMEKAPSIKGKVKAGRRHASTDFIKTDKPEFPPTVSQDLFSIVQAKLKESSDKHRHPTAKSPRSGELWLKGFLVCSKCQKPMRSWNTTKGRNKPSYFCATYGTYGKENPTGCRCHRVMANVLEKIVESYLTEVGRKAVVYAKGEGEPISKEMIRQAFGKHAEWRKAWSEMKQFILDSLDDGDNQFNVFADMQNDDGTVEYSPPIVVTKEGDEFSIDMEDEGFSTFDLYDFLQRRQHASLSKSIKAKEKEFDAIYERFKDLSTQTAKARANEEMQKLESEIAELRLRLEPLDKKVMTLWREFNRLHEAANYAKSTLQESNHRRKHEALKAIIDRIVCHFRYSNVKAANQAKSFLDKVEIIPSLGEAVGYDPNGNRLGHVAVWITLFYRRFTPQEIIAIRRDST